MSVDLENVDPKWAWSAYEPSKQAPWNRARAAHLFRRAGFAATTKQLDDAAAGDSQTAIQGLLDPGDTARFDDEMESFSKIVLATRAPKGLSAWWLYRMLYTPDQLLEKTTLFWHGHFATSAAKVTNVRPMLRQNALLRRYARGDFEKLVHEISRDPAMLIYLDSTDNRKTHPNENYARELMELFVLGLGNYTEKDIQEIARCFTGWQVRRVKFEFNPYQHDRGVKSFLGSSGEFDGEDAVRVVVEQKAAPRFIVSKLIRYFVFDEPAPPSALVDPLADDLREHDFDISRVLSRILSSNLFFSDYAVGRKIRSPVEMGIGMLRALEATSNLNQLGERCADLGQSPFFPPSVKGWDGGRTWINSSTLLGRANMVREIVRGDDTKFAGGDLESLAAKHGKRKPDAVVDWLLGLLVAVPVPDKARQSLIQLAGTKGSRNNNLANVIHAISTLPEFQLC